MCHRLVKSVGGLPRPRKEDLVYDEEREEEMQRLEEMREQREEQVEKSVCKLTVPSRTDKNLGVITEDEELAEQQEETEAAGENYAS